MKIRRLAFIIITCLILITGCNEVEIGPKRQVTEYSEKRYDLNKSLELDFESDSSNVEVYSWGKKQVKFEITKVIRGIGTAEKLEGRLKNFVIDTEQKNNSVYFQSKYKGGIKNPADKSVDVKIYLPKRMKSVKMSVDMGKVTFYDDIACDMNIEMNMANIDINRFAGKITLHGDMGNLRIGGGRITGESKVEVNMGNIDIKSAYDVMGDSSFFTKLGNIMLQLPEDSKIYVESLGDLRQNDFSDSKFRSKIKVESGMGRIDIKKY